MLLYVVIITISSHQSHESLLNRLFMRRSKKTSKLRVTGLCAGNSPVTGEFPAQRASNAENVSIWWRHHGSVSHPKWRHNALICGDLSALHVTTRETETSIQKQYDTNIRGPWISNCIHYKVWDEITYPFLYFNRWSLGMDK